MKLSPRLRTTLRRIGATTSALAVLTGVTAVVGAGYLRPAPTSEPVAAPEVTVGAGPISLVCAGPPRITTDDAGNDIAYDEEFGPSPAGVATLVEGVVVGREGQAPGPASSGALGSADRQDVTVAGEAGFVSASEVTSPSVLVAQPSDDVAALAAGATLARSDTGDLRGLVAASCQAPSSTIWLVGGMTALGSSARLTLTNPGDTPVTATLAAWGATGPVESGAAVVVPPGQARVVLLETLSLEPRIAVRVDAEGGRITASVQDSELRGVVPAGVDIVTATADPSTEVTIGPVPLIDVAPADADPSVVRLVNPNKEAATVSVSLLGPGGELALPGAQGQVLEPGTVTDISLAGVAAGSYTVRVTSDQPVTGAVMLTRVGQPGEIDPDQPVLDRAWLSAAVPVQHGLVSVPGAGSLVEGAGLAVTNPSQAEEQVTLRTIQPTGEAGEPITVAVAAGTTVTIGQLLDLTGAVAVEVSGEWVLASVALTAEVPDGQLLAMLGTTADPDLQQSVTVRLGTS
ncbi:MAG: hypothetical protein JJE50_13570 [Actinomycetales bacterium]|nr:hypothetical protein [Actinomycetales bacterium]